MYKLSNLLLACVLAFSVNAQENAGLRLPAGFSATLFAQKEYYYLRIFHYNLENPAALHLQGKVSGNSGFGFGTSNNDRRLNGFYSGCYYIKALNQLYLGFTVDNTLIQLL